ncbi:Arp2/3 complex 34 kDa subunit [Entamoeba marina]
MPPTLTLETCNRIIKKPLRERLADFNQSLWYITRSKEGEMKVYTSLQCWKELKSNGAWTYLQEVYGDAIAEDGKDYDVVLTVPESADKPEEYAMKVAKLQTHMMIGPAMMIIKDLNAGKAPEKLVQIDYRPGESMWLKPNGDRLTVLFSVKFDDKDDAVFGRVFINEFAKSSPGCPACDVVTRKNAPPPSELRGAKGLAEDNCYLSFLLEKRHMNNPVKTLETLVSCRNYINYHIKCSKAFLHIRMRNKVQALQLVLNRAKPVRETEKKTASGRSFKK